MTDTGALCMCRWQKCAGTPHCFSGGGTRACFTEYALAGHTLRSPRTFAGEILEQLGESALLELAHCLFDFLRLRTRGDQQCVIGVYHHNIVQPNHRDFTVRC